MIAEFSDERLTRHDLGFLEVREKPTVEELETFYAERYYQEERGNYRQEYPADELAYMDYKIAQKHHLIQQAGYAKPCASLLDVGCGEGFVMKWFHDKGHPVLGLDFSDAGVESMNPSVKDLVQTGDVFQAIDTKVDAGEQYDILWLQHVLEHVLDPLHLLQSLTSLVSENGVMLITVPNDGSELQEMLFARGDVDKRSWIALPDHMSYFTAESLRTTVEATGWQCIDMISDFPVDLFLLHEGSNYVKDPTQGRAAHQAKIQMELMLARRGHEVANNWFRASAAAGIGRSLTAVVVPSR